MPAQIITVSGEDYVLSYNKDSVQLSTTEATKEVRTIEINRTLTELDRGKYFVIYDTNDNAFVFWVDYNACNQNKPNLPGIDPSKVAYVPVNIEPSDDTTDAIATKFTTEIVKFTEFDGSRSGSVITVTNHVSGHCKSAHDGDTGFVITTTSKGYNDGQVFFSDLPWLEAEEIIEVNGVLSGASINLTGVIRKVNKVVETKPGTDNYRIRKYYGTDKAVKNDWYVFS